MKTFLIAAAALTLAPVAHAGPAATPAPVAKVAYSDLDLRDPAHAQTMLKRIRKAAVAVCGAGGGGYDETMRFETCYRETLDRAVSQLNAPVVTAAFQGTQTSHELAWSR